MKNINMNIFVIKLDTFFSLEELRLIKYKRKVK